MSLIGGRVHVVPYPIIGYVQTHTAHKEGVSIVPFVATRADFILNQAWKTFEIASWQEYQRQIVSQFFSPPPPQKHSDNNNLMTKLARHTFPPYLPKISYVAGLLRLVLFSCWLLAIY